MNPHHENAHKTSWLLTPVGMAFCVFLAIAAFFLVTEHSAHLFGILPYLLLLACPLMHLFMHHGHSEGHDYSGPDEDDKVRGGP